MPDIVILTHQVRWPADFALIGGAVRSSLGEVALRIDHIGSTAVPGLAAKDIIDVQIAVERLDHPALGPSLEAVGAVERGQPMFDHVPPGATIHVEQRHKRLWHLRDSTPHANLHVRVAGRWNWRYALLCRDFLRAHPATAAAYGEVKRQLARLFPDDADSYYDVKDPAFDLFMSLADDWAERTGWEPGDSDA